MNNNHNVKFVKLFENLALLNNRFRCSIWLEYYTFKYLLLNFTTKKNIIIV